MTQGLNRIANEVETIVTWLLDVEILQTTTK